MATTHSGQANSDGIVYGLDAGDADARTWSSLCLLDGNHARCAQLHLGNHSRRGNSARTGLSLFSGLFNLLFSTEFAQFPSPSSPSTALVPTKQSRPEHGAARILPFEIGRKILLAQTKNLLLFLHSGSNTELLLQSPRRGGLTDCARSLAAALSQNSTRSRRASRSRNVLLFSSSLSLALSCEEGSFGGDAAVKRMLPVR